MGQLPNQLNVCGEHHRLVTLQMIDADVLAPHSTIFQLLAGPTNHNDKDLWNYMNPGYFNLAATDLKP